MNFNPFPPKKAKKKKSEPVFINIGNSKKEKTTKTLKRRKFMPNSLPVMMSMALELDYS